ncbi:glycosyltransferase family 4 protein [Pseudothauera lacus]|uniref:Glycosyl transferase family 1 n=1 Tax=Pseudothauera lacus TaxID=2136175 RepID=A0A2T4IG59_9RHOO|nr:glycosyltransferase family 4 protein [Pseudothauera lacus]PTD96772.1 glycosyl transferase family 1 [Pseudothauera lacus]
MKVALLCSGLGNVNRGHEVFARDLFDLLSGSIDITLFKGGGEAAPQERVVANVPRNAGCLQDIHLPVSPRWQVAMQEQERIRVETETFAHAALLPLLEGDYDIIHCLEQEVCTRLYGFRHLFARPPRLLFSNGGAIPAARLPACDFVQEHTAYNLRSSAREKAFVIPHGVDCTRFHPGVESDFRSRHGIPPDAFVVISVGTVCYFHKRMDYVIREVAEVPGAYLVVVGQECADTAEIVALGRSLMGERIVFTRMAHDELPQAYAAADVFALGSLFETFGIVYIEAMAMGLPVFCTEHPNQRSIVREGVFLDLRRPGVLRDALLHRDAAQMALLRRRGPEIVAASYSLDSLKAAYLEHYARIAASPVRLPSHSLGSSLRNNLRNLARKVLRRT